MHSQESRAEFRHALDTSRNRIADIVQLEVEEHFLAGLGELAHQWQAAGISELIPDLVEAHTVAEPRDHRLRRIDAWEIERHNQSVAGSDSRSRHVTSHHVLGKIDQL